MPNKTAKNKPAAATAAARASAAATAGLTANAPTRKVAGAAWGDALPTRAQSNELKRSSIVRAAAHCFNRAGFHGTSMDDIAARLGVTKAALYRYVTTKHEVLFAAFNIAMDSSFANLDNGEKTGRDGIDKLRITLSGYLHDLIGALGHPVVLLEEGALQPEQARIIIARRDEAEMRYRKLVIEGMADGSIAPCNPKLAVFAILGAINWVPKWYRADGEWPASVMVDSLVNLLVRSIAARPGPLLSEALGKGLGGEAANESANGAATRSAKPRKR